MSGGSGREKWVGSEIDDEEWEQGKNAADDQIFVHPGVFTEYCARPTKANILLHEFPGLHLSLTRTISKAKNKDTNTQGIHR